MLEVSVSAFRNHVPDYLDRMHQGEEIALTLRGKIVARLVPPEGGGARARQQLTALRANCHIDDVISTVGEDWEADRADS